MVRLLFSTVALMLVYMALGGVLGNVGFLGMPLIASIFPNEPIVLVYSTINVMSMNLIVFTVGKYRCIPNNHSKCGNNSTYLLGSFKLHLMIIGKIFLSTLLAIDR